MTYSVPVKSVKEGTILICDGSSFFCLDDQEEVIVKSENNHLSNNDFYVPCRCGFHFLDGQLDENEENYIGFRLKE